MAEAVYLLCMLTSVACAVLLLRAYRDKRVRLLLWSGLCFAGLSVNNFLLFFDQAVVKEVDLGMARTLAGLIAVSLLVFGLIWETE